MRTERDEFVTLFAAALQGINAHGESWEAVSVASRQAKEAMDEIKNRFPHYINDVIVNRNSSPLALSLPTERLSDNGIRRG